MREIERRLLRLEAGAGAASPDGAEGAREAALATIMARLDRIRDAAGPDAPRASAGEVRECLRGLGYFQDGAA